MTCSCRDCQELTTCPSSEIEILFSRINRLTNVLEALADPDFPEDYDQLTQITSMRNIAYKALEEDNKLIPISKLTA